MRRSTLLLAGLLIASSTPGLAQDGATSEEAAPEATEAATQETADPSAAGEGEASDEAPADTAPQEPAATPEETAEADEEPARPSQPTRSSRRPASDARIGTASEADAGGGAGAERWRRITEAELTEPSESYPYVETHGYFRFRADGFWNLDMSTNGTSSVLPPVEALVNADTRDGGVWADIPEDITLGDGTELSLGEYTKDGANFIGSANMRLRLRPTIHLSQAARIHTQFDILDNIVLGSTPHLQDSPLVLFSQSSQSPTAAEFGRDAVRVTQAYGEFRTFLGTLRVGRMTNHWGLGIMFNNGGDYSALREPRLSYRGVAMAGNTCIDCDYGDFVDRASFETEIFDHTIMLAYDYAFAGPTTQANTGVYGQPRDLGQFDDVRSLVVSVTNRPTSPEEIGERNRQLEEERRPTFDYGAYFMYRNQRISPEQCADPLDADSCQFTPRGAQLFIPDVWFRLQHSPGFRRRLRIEGEFVAVLGNLDYAAAAVGDITDDNNSRDIRQVAAALEMEYVNMALALGFNAGFASGRQAGGSPGLGANYDTNQLSDERLTGFSFNRDYFVDMIMFREIIGTVTNAMYVNPFFQYDLFSKRNDTLGVRVDLITALAANAAATPSGNAFYGVEGNLSVYYRQPRYGADLSVGLFLPGNAFNAVPGRPRFNDIGAYRGTATGTVYEDGDERSANPATTLQARFYWAF